MALYLGSNPKDKVILNNIVYKINLSLGAYVIDGIRLASSEGYILKDSNGMYLTASSADDLSTTYMAAIDVVSAPENDICPTQIC